MSHVLDAIQSILRQIYEDDTIIAEPNLQIRQLEKWDSFNHINMAIALESTFHIELSPAELERIDSVADLVGILREHGVSE